MKPRGHQKAKKTTINVVSLFSGAMGLDLGLEKAGLRLAVAVECDPIAVATIKANKPRLGIIAKRIENVSTAEIKTAGKLKRGDHVVVVGGPSCQAFSTAGQRKSLEDPRGIMFQEFVRVVRELRPRFFIMENVPGLLSAAVKHRTLAKRGPGNPKLKSNEELGSAFKRVVTAFEKLNYYVAFDILNAADYGVPQARERLVLIGSRNGERITFPTQTHDRNGKNGLPTWTTLRSAIGDLTRRKHEYRPFRRLKARRLSRIPQGGNWRDLPKRMQVRAIGGAYKSWGGRTGFLRRLAWDKPSPALMTTPNGNATCLCHPTKTRPLSMTEYARIQQFPDSWRFSGSTTQKYRQIGNAVPVGLGRVLGAVIKKALKEKPRRAARGKVECRSAKLMLKLKKTKRTYVNPPRMRRYPKASTLSRWLKGKPRIRNKEVEAYAAVEVRRLLAKIILNTATPSPPARFRAIKSTNSAPHTSGQAVKYTNRHPVISPHF